MAIDPRKLRPADLCRLLNWTPLGEVIGERQLHRHRTRAGFGIGDSRHVDLFRYVAWLATSRHELKPEKEVAGYEALKEQARARNAALSLAGRDIGDLPEVVNPERKQQASGSFRFFCESYFPLTFHLNWSPDHLKVIAKIEQAVLHGGLFALAMPRGSGKTCWPSARQGLSVALRSAARRAPAVPEHLTAEYRVRTEGRGREVDEWKLRPERSDNHWLDCLVGSAVAASVGGVTLANLTPAVKVKRRRIVPSQIQAARRAGKPVEPLLRGYLEGQHDSFNRQQGRD